MNNSNKEKTLSFIIENDENYGDKLTKLLCYNSKKVPILGISNIKYKKNIEQDMNELDSFLDLLISNREVDNKFSMQLNNTCNNIVEKNTLCGEAEISNLSNFNIKDNIEESEYGSDFELEEFLNISDKDDYLDLYINNTDNTNNISNSNNNNLNNNNIDNNIYVDNNNNAHVNNGINNKNSNINNNNNTNSNINININNKQNENNQNGSFSNDILQNNDILNEDDVKLSETITFSNNLSEYFENIYETTNHLLNQTYNLDNDNSSLIDNMKVYNESEQSKEWKDQLELNKELHDELKRQKQLRDQLKEEINDNFEKKELNHKLNNDSILNPKIYPEDFYENFNIEFNNNLNNFEENSCQDLKKDLIVINKDFKQTYNENPNQIYKKSQEFQEKKELYDLNLDLQEFQEKKLEFHCDLKAIEKKKIYFNNKELNNEYNVEDWKLKIENMMKTNDKSYLNNNFIENNNFNLNSRNDLSGIDLKNDVIKEIKDELKNCRLSLSLIQKNNEDNLDLTLETKDINFDNSYQKINELNNEIFINNNNHTYLYPKANKLTKNEFDIKSLKKNHIYPTSKLNDNNQSIINNVYNSENENNELSKTLNLSYKINDDFNIKSPKNNETKINSDINNINNINTNIYIENSVDNQNINSNNIIMAIKLLSIIRDIKRQIELIKNK